MDKSKFLGLNLPSRNNTTDVADINVISENFEIIDEWAKNRENELKLINDASGNAIVLKDSANAPLQQLKVFGKTTQDGTPTPTAPKELKSVGDSGSFEVGVYGGKNLMPVIQNSAVNIFTPLADGIKISGTTTGAFAQNISQVTQKFTLGKGKYKLVCFANGSLGGASIYLCLRVGASTNYTQALANGGVVEFEVTETTSFLPFIYIQQSGVTVDCTVYGMVTTINADTTTYEPFKNKQTLTMPYTLRSVGEVKDEIDFNRGVLIQRCGARVFTGAESWTWNSGNKQFVHNPMIDWARGQSICSHYTSEMDKDYSAFISGSKLYVNIQDPRFDGDISAFKEWLTSNNFTLIYALVTPQEIALSETELNAYRQLHTNRPNTTIISEAEMKVEYIIDTKTYIDNKFAELTALTLEV